jgi:hypothetical protein
MPTRPAEPFAASIEIESTTYWYYRAYPGKDRAERVAKIMRDRGYKTYVVNKAGVNALYTYPNERFAMS